MNNIKKTFIGALSLGLVASIFATDASASTTSVGTNVEGGSLSLNDLSITQFGGIKLNGTNQSLTTAISPFSVVDATGTGSGWKLSVSATQLTTADGMTLPSNSLSISAPTIAAVAGSSAAEAIDIASGDIDTLTGVKLLSAGVDEGMGTYNLTNAELTIDLQPKDTKSGTYSSTVTFSLVTGP